MLKIGKFLSNNVILYKDPDYSSDDVVYSVKDLFFLFLYGVVVTVCLWFVLVVTIITFS